MSQSENGGQPTIGAQVDPEFKRRVRIAAAEEGMSQSEAIRVALREWLSS